LPANKNEPWNYLLAEKNQSLTVIVSPRLNGESLLCPGQYTLVFPAMFNNEPARDKNGNNKISQ
jgi:hypothetical protein